MNNKVFTGLLIVAAGIVAGWFILGGNNNFLQSWTKTQPTGTTSVPTAMTRQGPSGALPIAGTFGGSTEKGGVSERTVITYTDTGFAPSPVTVKKGATVTFVNESSRGMWVASAMHPTHQLLPGFDQLKTVGKSGTYEYVFTKVGTWKYHNHVNPADTGSVAVTE